MLDHTWASLRAASDWMLTPPPLLLLSLPPKRKLGAPRRNLKKVVRLPALSLRPSLNPCTSERARAPRREGAYLGRISEVDASRSAKEPATAVAAPSKVARRYRSRSRTRPERERRERERESLERTCCARTSTSLQRTSPGRLRPSNTFRRNRDFSQLWTRAGERDQPTRAYERVPGDTPRFHYQRSFRTVYKHPKSW